MNLVDAARRLEEHPVRPPTSLAEIERRAAAIRRRRAALAGAGTGTVAVAVVAGVMALGGPDGVPVRTGPAAAPTTVAPTTAAPPATTPPSVVEGVSGDLQVSLAAPVQAAAGTVVTFEVSASDPSGRLFGFELDPGDGSTVAGLPIDQVCGPVSWADPTDSTDQLVHAYRVPGRYTATLTVVTGGCEAPVERVEVDTTVLVTGEAGPSNGPRAPEPSAVVLETDPTGTVSVEAGASDRDGFVSKVSVDWGDGSSPSVLTADPSECVEDPARWVHSALRETVNHRYDAGGTYQVTVTAVSQGCDGAAVQDATTELTVETG